MQVRIDLVVDLADQLLVRLLMERIERRYDPGFAVQAMLDNPGELAGRIVQ